MLKDKNKLILFIIFIIYTCLSFFIGFHHEPWSDEAQSWLIARDCSFYDIMFTRCSYEGTPFLWYYILKIFIILGGTYKYLFVVSCFFSCLGVFLFLFKSKFPTIIKILFPFGYYIIYQYTVVSRCYSLMFPTLCLIAVFYNKRFEKPFLYCGLLAILASIHAYGYVISLILMFFLIADEVLKYFFNHKISRGIEVLRYRGIEKTEKNSCHSERSEESLSFHTSIPPYINPSILSPQKIIPVIFLTCYLIFIALISMKNPDCYYMTFKGFFNLDFWVDFFVVFVLPYFDVKTLLILPVWLVIISFFYYISIKTFCRNKKQVLYFLVTVLVLMFVIELMVSYIWHIGVLFLLFIFFCWAFQNENDISVDIKTNKLFCSVWILIFVVQILFGMNACLNEVYNEYDSSENVAKFLKGNNLDKEKIIGIGCNVSIQPYFDKNIYINWNTAYFPWSKKIMQENINRIKENILTAKVLIIERRDMFSAIEYKFLEKYYQTFDKYFVFDSQPYARTESNILASTYIVFVRD